MSDIITQVREILLVPAGLTENHLQTILGKTLSKSIDAADIYIQSSHHETWTLEDSIIKEGHFDIQQGVGIRAISGERTGFAYSDEIILHVLEQAATAAVS